jgi:hypothetical protein
MCQKINKRKERNGRIFFGSYSRAAFAVTLRTYLQINKGTEKGEEGESVSLGQTGTQRIEERAVIV